MEPGVPDSINGLVNRPRIGDDILEIGRASDPEARELAGRLAIRIEQQRCLADMHGDEGCELPRDRRRPVVLVRSNK